MSWDVTEKLKAQKARFQRSGFFIATCAARGWVNPVFTVSKEFAASDLPFSLFFGKGKQKRASLPSYGIKIG
jgi:hypothetical protein